MSKEISRKCLGCNEIKNREELIKITKETKTGKVFINPNTKIFGRSVYLCYNKTCIKDALKKNKLVKVLKSSLPDEIKDTLQNF